MRTMRGFLIPRSTRVTLVTPAQRTVVKELLGDVLFYEDSLLTARTRHSLRAHIPDGSMGFLLCEGWGPASHGLLIVEPELVRQHETEAGWPSRPP